MTELGIQQEELQELQRRLTLLKIGLCLLMGLLAIRLWYLQVHEGLHYRDLSQTNRTRVVILEPARGLIYDRNGILLANNVPSFNLYITPEDVKDRDALITRLTELIGLDGAVVRKKLAQAGSTLLPRNVKGGLSLRQAALIESHRLDLPGVVIRAESQRNYVHGQEAAHLLAYVGEVSPEQLERDASQELHQGSIVGQDGAERAYDRFLRGRAGQKVVEVHARGHEIRTVSVKKPEAGD
ncbi:MAG: hypothetical protein ACREIS_00570, partial [Nitrospiraceae bacterium]